MSGADEKQLTAAEKDLEQATERLIEEQGPTEQPTDSTKRKSKEARSAIRYEVDHEKAKSEGKTAREAFKVEAPKPQEIFNQPVDKFLQLDQVPLLHAVSGLKNDQLKPGVEFSTNFGNSPEIQRAVGLSMIMPDTVTSVSVNGVKGRRQGPKGNFYSDSGEYLAIFEGDAVKIETVHNEEQVKKQRQNRLNLIKEWGRAITQPNLPLPEKKHLLETCGDYSLDPFLLLAIREVNNGQYGHDVSGEAEAQIKVAGKYLQTAKVKFTSENPGTQPEKDGHYTPEFIAYLLTHYTLFGEPTPENTAQIKKVVETYYKSQNLPVPTFDFGKYVDKNTQYMPTKPIDVPPSSAPPSGYTNELLPQQEIANRNNKSARRNPQQFYQIALEDHAQNAPKLQLLSSMKSKIDGARNIIVANRSRYEKVAQNLGVPWKLIGAIHYRESSCNFKTYLHNGDPLGRPTTHVPKGLLFNDWETAAEHAIRKFKRRGLSSDSSDLARMMLFAESYNGFGYRWNGRRSEYVYGGTNMESMGRYTHDSKFDSSQRATRPGVAAILIAMQGD